MVITAYPVANKRKSFDICLAFIRGCGGSIGTADRGGSAFFYGVDQSNIDVWNRVRSDGSDYFYCDNSYFDSARQQRFRVTKNRLQHTGIGVSDGKRFAALGIDIKPWRTAGEHIVVCPQSAAFMRTIAGYSGDWPDAALRGLRARTTRPIRMRPWSADKAALGSTLAADLAGAHALVTWSSAAAVTAILAGVPVVVEANDCAARFLSGSDLEDLPTPARENWAGVLADNEFSLDELRNGMAWAKLK